MTDTKRILVVEDDAGAAELIRCALEAEGDLSLEPTGSLAEARTAIDRAPPDLVIAALKLPDGRGTDLIPGFELVAMYPVVVMAASGDETTAVAAMKAGALDYVVKSEATLLDMAQVARRALREWNLLVDRRRAEIAVDRQGAQMAERGHVVASINRVAQALGKKTTIAEYVESEQILSRMAETGVEFVQGYGVGKPQPIGDMAGLRALGGKS